MKTTKDEILYFLKQQMRDRKIKTVTLTQFQKLRSLMKRPFHYHGIAKGSIFETESSIFIVGIKLPPMKFLGKHVIGLTTDSPLFSIFEHKQHGDAVIFGSDIEHISII